MRKAATALLLSLGAIALAGCTTPHSVLLDRIVYAARYAQNGPQSDLKVYWYGEPVFPLTVKLTPAPGCSRPNLTCEPGSFTDPSRANPLVWKGATGCSGSAPAGLPPWRGSYYYWLEDAVGHQSAKALLTETCYFTPTPVAFATATEHQEAWLASVLRPAADVSWKLGDVARSLAISIGLIFLVAFPAQLFNGTLQAHYDEVTGWFRRLRPIGRPAGRLGGLGVRLGSGTEHAAGLVLALVAAGILESLLDPRWAFDAATAEAVLGLVMATAAVTAVHVVPNAVFTRRYAHAAGRLRVFGTGLAIAAACVLVSRLTAAQPGYMYGVVLGFWAGTAPLARHLEGARAALTAAGLLALGVGFWLLYGPVKPFADAGQSFWWLTLADALAAVFVAAITTALFGLLPLRWLDGERLLSWRWFVWLPLVLAGMFLFVHVVLDNAAHTVGAGRSLQVSVILFIAFGLLSTGFWAFFRLRDAGTREPAPAAAGSA